MENDNPEFLDGFKPIEILPRIRKFGERILQVGQGAFYFLPTEPLAPHGDHPPRGAAAMLDEQLDEDGGV